CLAPRALRSFPTRRSSDLGFTRLHLVDLDGAKNGRVVNWDVIGSICRETSLKVDVGGGIKTEEELKRLLDLGASQVNLGSIAVRSEEHTSELQSREKLVCR